MQTDLIGDLRLRCRFLRAGPANNFSCRLAAPGFAPLAGGREGFYASLLDRRVSRFRRFCHLSSLATAPFIRLAPINLPPTMPGNLGRSSGASKPHVLAVCRRTQIWLVPLIKFGSRRKTVTTGSVERLTSEMVPHPGTFPEYLEFIRLQDRSRNVTLNKRCLQCDIRGNLLAYPLFAPVFAGAHGDAGRRRRVCSRHAGGDRRRPGRVFEMPRTEDGTLPPVPQGLGDGAGQRSCRSSVDHRRRSGGATQSRSDYLASAYRVSS